MYSAIDQAIEIPSYVLVPLPISSNNIKLFWLKLFKILAVSFISTIKVDSPIEILSDAPTRVKILSTKPISALSAGTKQPICAIKTIKAVCLKIADLPDIFGPVIMIICWSSLLSIISFGI